MVLKPDGQELYHHGALRQPEPLALGMCWQLIFSPRFTCLSNTARNPDLQIQRRNLSPPKNQDLPKKTFIRRPIPSIRSLYDLRKPH